MREKIFVIEDHFQIKGRGLIITGKIEKNSPELKIGAPIIVCRPDGSEVKTKIAGIEMCSPPNFEIESILIHNLTKEDLPIGSSVFKNSN